MTEPQPIEGTTEPAAVPLLKPFEAAKNATGPLAQKRLKAARLVERAGAQWKADTYAHATGDTAVDDAALARSEHTHREAERALARAEAAAKENERLVASEAASAIADAIRAARGEAAARARSFKRRASKIVKAVALLAVAYEDAEKELGAMFDAAPAEDVRRLGITPASAKGSLRNGLHVALVHTSLPIQLANREILARQPDLTELADGLIGGLIDG